MKILYYDCFSGISGDMNLGAMVDLGVDKSYLINELKKLNLGGYTINFETDQRKGITGTRADVTIGNATPKFGTVKPISTENVDLHSHNQGHTHTHNQLLQPNLQEERTYSTIQNLVEKSNLSDSVKRISMEIFKKIAIAEAHVHGKSLEEIHFHEVGAIDSIVDIVGAAICFDYLKPDKVISSPVQMGGGTVKCAHGIFPVPAPATLEILKDKPIRLGAVQVETTTPTGAAIIATFATEFMEILNLNITKIGYGIGHRDNEIPNVLRVCIAETPDNQAQEHAMMVECNIDDMNPEIYEYVMQKLFEAGADDVFFQPIIMKKTRPAIKISILCKPGILKKIEFILFSETSTLGIRKYDVLKSILERNWKTIDTQWGKIRIKQGFLEGKIIKSKPEYEDCLKISIENKIPLTTVYMEISKLIQID